MFNWEQAEGSIITLAFLGVARLITAIRGDGNKILDTQLAQQRLSLEADAQETSQDVLMAPIWKDLVTTSQAQAAEIAGELKLIRDEHVELRIRVAVAAAENQNTKDRLSTLEDQNKLAISKHEADAKVIAGLTGEVATLRVRVEQLEDQVADKDAANAQLGAENERLSMALQKCRETTAATL